MRGIGTSDLISTDKIANRYDRWSSIYDWVDSFGPFARSERKWRGRVVEKLNLNGWILDAACGPGVMVDHLSRSGFDGRVIAIDASKKMVKKAKSKFEIKSLNGVAILGDVNRLPLKDSCLCGVICVFSLTTIGLPGRAVVEFDRVLMWSANLVVLDSQKPDGKPARVIYPILVPISRLFCHTYIDRDVDLILSGQKNLSKVWQEKYLGGMVALYVYKKVPDLQCKQQI